ncbi:hypothetical protein [Actinoplanes missouriensis]|nr:hypothetical protein [Actinoplanes missouriensis]
MTTQEEFDEAYALDQDDWSDPIPDGARHAMPGLEGPVPCCGRDPDRLPHGDWMTSDPERVTCTGPETAS